MDAKRPDSPLHTAEAGPIEVATTRRPPRSIQTLARLLTAEEVAEHTGLSTETLAQWRSQKRGIPYLKIGGRIRYDPADVHEYLRGCRVSVSAPTRRRQR